MVFDWNRQRFPDYNETGRVRPGQYYHRRAVWDRAARNLKSWAQRNYNYHWDPFTQWRQRARVRRVFGEDSIENRFLENRWQIERKRRNMGDVVNQALEGDESAIRAINHYLGRPSPINRLVRRWRTRRVRQLPDELQRIIQSYTRVPQPSTRNHDYPRYR